MKAIREFPRPTNNTDLRSYYSLVNQVSHFHAVSPNLELFQELIKKSVTWYWDDALEKFFEESREHIAKSAMR